MGDSANGQTGILNQLLANNSQYAKSFDKPMTLGVKKKVGGSVIQLDSEKGNSNVDEPGSATCP
jgi:hypothetical protein